MRGYVVYPESVLSNKSNAFEWFKSEAEKLDIELEILFTERFSLVLGENGGLIYDNRELEVPDFVILRDYNVLLASHFETMGVRLVNSALSMELSKNKLLTSQVLVSKSLQTPKTYYKISQNYSYDELVEFLGCEKVVMKGLEGAKGERVHLVSNEKELCELLDAISYPILAQEFVETSFGRDLRVWVIGDKVVACVQRSSESDFRSNFSLGGNVAGFELDEIAEKMAVDSVKALGLEFAGVDLLFTGDGYSVCEVNGNAGFRSLTYCGSEVNMVAELLKYIKNS